MKKTKKRLGKKAQGVTEYILLVAIVIAFLLIFFKLGNPFSLALYNVIKGQGSDMLNAARTVF